MKVRVTKRGVLVPKKLLGDAEEVEIRKEAGRIVISLLTEHDPIFDLGKNPVDCGIPDGAEHHDRYLCGSRQ